MKGRYGDCSVGSAEELAECVVRGARAEGRRGRWG